MTYNRMTINACAKINLTLDITGKRSDSYHDLRSIMQSVSLVDTVTLEQNDSGAVTLSCSTEGVPCDERNIAVKCANVFYKETGIECKGLHIDIKKKIPMQAGLAGGSADGAAVLFGLNEMYDRPLTEEELILAGKQVGADIPFCLIGGTALAEGIGEKLTKLEKIPDCFFVIVKPDIGISTAQAYGAVDKAGFNGQPHTDNALCCLNDLAQLGKSLYNDFEQALRIEPIIELTGKLKDFPGCLGSCMSGSGSAVFAVFEDREDAEACHTAIQCKYPFAEVVRPTDRGTYLG